jgi:hypothetical protein
MRKTLGVAALMLALCGPALAGEIPNPPAPQPQANTVQEPTATGDIQNGSADSLTEIALDLLAVLPSLF